MKGKKRNNGRHADAGMGTQNERMSETRETSRDRHRKAAIAPIVRFYFQLQTRLDFCRGVGPTFPRGRPLLELLARLAWGALFSVLHVCLVKCMHTWKTLLQGRLAQHTEHAKHLPVVCTHPVHFLSSVSLFPPSPFSSSLLFTPPRPQRSGFRRGTRVRPPSRRASGSERLGRCFP